MNLNMIKSTHTPSQACEISIALHWKSSYPKIFFHIISFYVRLLESSIKMTTQLWKCRGVWQCMFTLESPHTEQNYTYVESSRDSNSMKRALECEICFCTCTIVLFLPFPSNKSINVVRWNDEFVPLNPKIF